MTYGLFQMHEGERDLDGSWLCDPKAMPRTHVPCDVQRLLWTSVTYKICKGSACTESAECGPWGSNAAKVWNFLPLILAAAGVPAEVQCVDVSFPIGLLRLSP